MKFSFSKEQRSWGFIAFLVVAAGAVFIAFLLHLGEVFAAVKTVLSLFIPFYIGFAIAYLLNPILKFWEEKVFKKIKKPQWRRVLAMGVTYSLFLIILGSGIAYLLPRLITSLTNLVNEIPDYYNAFVASATAFIEEHPSIHETYDRYSVQIHQAVERIVQSFSGYLSGLLPKVANATLKVGSGLVNTFVGIVISIYLLHGKEKLTAQSKKVLNFIFKKEESYQRVLNVGRVTHEKTLNYISGRLLDSLIVAVITYLFFTICRIPYALLGALSVGIFNTIPYFGSFLGAIPPAIIVLITRPGLFIPYLIFILLLEQLDGNVIGPKIQGKQLGLSALWIIFAIFLFGGLFGFFGMVLGVPIFAVIYYFVHAAINNGLENQGKSADTLDYAPPEAQEIIKEEIAKEKNEN